IAQHNDRAEYLYSFRYLSSVLLSLEEESDERSSQAPLGKTNRHVVPRAQVSIWISKNHSHT
ncbi:hypothetical protein, partial [Bacillus inaquosorum]|uniref:hypothetical protein n=1 Tax=Bacillus inaquosorum TaxID=483913 RepID=UPI00398FDA32